MIKDLINPIADAYIDEVYQPICPKCHDSSIEYGFTIESDMPCFVRCTSCGAYAEGDTIDEALNKLDAME